jgi:FkbM family methyltransferase
MRGRLVEWILWLADFSGRAFWRDRPPRSSEEPMKRRQVRELLRSRTIPLRARLDGFTLYATRSWRRRPVALHLTNGRVYVDPNSLSADWETFREIFIPKYLEYASDYEDAAVVDVGAHKGYFAASALLAGARVVFSYEPEARNFALLERAARSFRRGGRWVTHKTAVGAEAGQADLQVVEGSSGSWAHSLIERPDGDETGRTERVDLVAMASVLRAAAAVGTRRLVVKVDAEGAECEIVAGTDLEMWAPVDEVFVEHHDFAPCELEEIVAHLERAGLTLRERRHGVARLQRGGVMASS